MYGAIQCALPRRFKRMIHVVDSTTIQLIANCLDWAKHRRRKAAAKMHLRLVNVSRHLERIGDYATNIDEDVIYMVNGAIVRHRTGIDGEFKKKRK